MGVEHFTEAIKEIGNILIAKAEDTTRDIEHVSSITIYATITPGEVPNVDITKNYIAVEAARRL